VTVAEAVVRLVAVIEVLRREILLLKEMLGLRVWKPLNSEHGLSTYDY